MYPRGKRRKGKDYTAYKDSQEAVPSIENRRPIRKASRTFLSAASIITEKWEDFKKVFWGKGDGRGKSGETEVVGGFDVGFATDGEKQKKPLLYLIYEKKNGMIKKDRRSATACPVSVRSRIPKGVRRFS